MKQRGIQGCITLSLCAINGRAASAAFEALVWFCRLLVYKAKPSDPMVFVLCTKRPRLSFFPRRVYLSSVNSAGDCTAVTIQVNGAEVIHRDDWTGKIPPFLSLTLLENLSF